jgi:hypothetical protein
MGGVELRDPASSEEEFATIPAFRIKTIVEIPWEFWQPPDRRLSFIDDAHADGRHPRSASECGGNFGRAGQGRRGK